MARIGPDPLECLHDVDLVALQHLQEAALIGIEHARQSGEPVVAPRCRQDRGDIGRLSGGNAADINQLKHRRVCSCRLDPKEARNRKTLPKRLRDRYAMHPAGWTARRVRGMRTGMTTAPALRLIRP
jgi:hypothetical protein